MSSGRRAAGWLLVAATLCSLAVMVVRVGTYASVWRVSGDHVVRYDIVAPLWSKVEYVADKITGVEIGPGRSEEEVGEFIYFDMSGLSLRLVKQNSGHFPDLEAYAKRLEAFTEIARQGGDPGILAEVPARSAWAIGLTLAAILLWIAAYLRIFLKR